MKLNTSEIIELYNNGEAMNAIANKFHTYATTIKRILEKNNVELRHDTRQDGSLYVKNGEKLIEWAKAQGRLVTKAELAKVAGTKRLSPSYFIKYPELGKYIVRREQNELQDYTQQLYDLLQENNIPYKPSDRTKLNVIVTAWLLGEYSNIIIQLDIRPTYISTKRHTARMEETKQKAIDNHMQVLFITKEFFANPELKKELIAKIKSMKK